MDRISANGLNAAIRLIREPVVVTYSYPRSHPLYGAGEECGVFVPMAIWKDWEGITVLVPYIHDVRDIKMPDEPHPVEGKRPFMDEDA